jgi:hypothetical protein
LQERQPCGVVSELAGRGSCRCRGVGELAEELVECGLAVVDGGSLVVGEGTAASMRWRLSLASSRSALEESFGV